MSFKYTPFGALLYATMILYIASCVAFLVRRRGAAWSLAAAGFLAAATCVAWRAVDAERVPLRNLFEVMLAVAALMPLLSYFARRFLGLGGEWGDLLIGLALLVPVGFVFDAAPGHLPPMLQTPLFGPHVAAYVIAYAILAKSAVAAAGLLLARSAADEVAARERAVYRLVGLAFPLLTAGLVLGAVWGKLAWGNWWNFDPKELWSLASWLVYLLYLHVRSAGLVRRPRPLAGLVVLGFVVVIITLLWVNLSPLFSGLHSYA
jgi:ABC-type transport system involved in cytochrome c biogenesis permease subunit